MSAAGWIVAALSAVLAVAGLGMTGHMMAHTVSYTHLTLPTKA